MSYLHNLLAVLAGKYAEERKIKYLSSKKSLRPAVKLLFPPQSLTRALRRVSRQWQVQRGPIPDLSMTNDALSVRARRQW